MHQTWFIEKAVTEGVVSRLEWDVKPGDRILRKELHDRFGGSRQGGICPCKLTPNILIFSEPQVGEQFGYEDGWGSDGYYYYTGSGQDGDQQMKRGNRAILDHDTNGKALRLFEGARGEVQYIGEFAVDPHKPWEHRTAPQAGSHFQRKVIIFRLKPVNN